jgi:hypothetical protein
MVVLDVIWHVGHHDIVVCEGGVLQLEVPKESLDALSELFHNHGLGADGDGPHLRIHIYIWFFCLIECQGRSVPLHLINEIESGRRTEAQCPVMNSSDTPPDGYQSMKEECGLTRSLLVVISMHGICVLIFIQEYFQEQGGIAEVLEFCQVWGQSAGFAEVSIYVQSPQPDCLLNGVHPTIGDALGQVSINEQPSQLMVGDHPLTVGAGIISKDCQEVLEMLSLLG